MLTKNVCDSFSYSESCIHTQTIVSTLLAPGWLYSGLMVSFPEALDKADINSRGHVRMTSWS